MALQQASIQVADKSAAIIDELKRLEGPLLPILHEIQEEFGYVPAETVPIIAEELNLAGPKSMASSVSITTSASTRPDGTC